MNKIGDYIPLIIIALTFIYSFVKGAKKKVTEEELSKTTLPNGLPQKNVVYRPESQPKPQPKPQSQVASRTQVASKGHLEIPKKNEEQSPISIGEITDNSGISIDFSDSEELKRGIIYSEIFNRRY